MWLDQVSFRLAQLARGARREERGHSSLRAQSTRLEVPSKSLKMAIDNAIVTLARRRAKSARFRIAQRNDNRLASRPIRSYGAKMVQV